MDLRVYGLIPLALGLVVVLQGTLNRQIGEQWGLAMAVFINATVFFILSVGLFLVSRYFPDWVPEFFRYRAGVEGREFKAIYLVPGICGFLLVLGLPWAIRNLGVGKALVILISSQVLVGFLWDQFIYKTQASGLKLVGALLSVLGAILSMI